MKSYFLIVLLLVFGSCQSTGENPKDSSSFNNQKETSTINQVLDNWHFAAGKSNFEDYFNAMDSTSVFIGTDASENWNKKAFMEFSKPYFDKEEAWSFTALGRNIYFSQNGKIAWFDELLDTWMGVCRGSGVLEKKDDTWKIKQYVLSVTVPNEKMDTLIELMNR